MLESVIAWTTTTWTGFLSTVTVGIVSVLLTVIAVMHWIDQLEAEVQQDQARESVLLSFGNDLSNSKACLRCKDPFPVLFARKKRCGICTFVVCRHCCRWDSRANLWRCHACARRRVLQLHSAAWLKDVPHHPNVEPILDSGIKRESDSENDSGYAPSVSPRGTNAPPPSLEHSGIYSEGGGPPEFFAGDEETTAAVRMHIERLIEAALGEEIDRVTLSKLAQHPQYDGLFHRYHRTLTDAINNLSIILEDAIQNRYDPSSTSPSPTDAHAALLHLIEEIQDSAQDLPPFKMSSQSKENQSEDEEGFDDNFSLGLECSGYADILSVAILNKIVCLGQPLLVHKSSEHMIVKENNRPSNTFVSRLEIGIQPIVTEDDLEESLPDTYKIEEEIKEVTTSYNDDDEMVSSLPKSNKVPFPELGVDLVDEDEIHHELQDSQRKGSDPSILVASSEQWEDNWLFRKKRMAAGNRISAAEPVPMLVPNPADEIRAQIGDRHADELSDLSDSPSDVEEHETDPEEEVKEPVPIINNTTVTKQEDSLEIEPEFAQQDSEYTEAYTSTMTRCKEPVVENIMPTELILNKSTPVPAPRIMTPPKWAENKPVVIVQVDHYQTKPNEPPSVEETIESDIPELLSAKTITERKQQWVAAETIVPVTEIPIVKQRINRSALARQRTTSLEFPEFETEEVAPATNIKTIDCGVKRAEQGRYSRDYYIHQQASTPKLPSSTTNSLPIIQVGQSTSTTSSDNALTIANFERDVLFGSMWRSAFTPRTACSNFSNNPLYHDNQELELINDQEHKRMLESRSSDSSLQSVRESGYYSSQDSLFLQIPVVVEQLLEPLSSLRRGGSLREPYKPKRNSSRSGSLRLKEKPMLW